MAGDAPPSPIRRSHDPSRPQPGGRPDRGGDRLRRRRGAGPRPSSPSRRGRGGHTGAGVRTSSSPLPPGDGDRGGAGLRSPPPPLPPGQAGGDCGAGLRPPSPALPSSGSGDDAGVRPPSPALPRRAGRHDHRGLRSSSPALPSRDRPVVAPSVRSPSPPLSRRGGRTGTQGGLRTPSSSLPCGRGDPPPAPRLDRGCPRGARRRRQRHVQERAHPRRMGAALPLPRSVAGRNWCG